MRAFQPLLVVLLAAFAAQPASAASYIVRDGDMLGSIAEKQLNAFSRCQEIYELNRERIPDADHLKPGLELLLPDASPQTSGKKEVKTNGKKEVETGEIPAAREKGFYYTVCSGDMVSSILSRFHLDQDEFVRLNRVEDLDSLSIGQKLFIPGPRERERRRGEFRQAHRGLLGDIGRLLGRALRWPIAGAISSGFGFRGNHFHAGVDIPDKTGSPIHAAEGGVVIRSSWFSNYGRVVDVAHKDGLVTRYAHCSKLLVSLGEPVSRGETIALVGSTGRATTPHLHFEIRLKDRPLNPEKFK